jgi:hypothetical protein
MDVTGGMDPAGASHACLPCLKKRAEFLDLTGSKRSRTFRRRTGSFDREQTYEMRVERWQACVRN